MAKKKILYKVVTNDSLSEWTTEDLYDAYRHAAYMSTLNTKVTVVEITIKTIWESNNGQQR